MKLKDYSNLKEMLIDFNEYSTDYTKTRCRELEETIKNTLKEIERLNKALLEIKEIIDVLETYSSNQDVLNDYNKRASKIRDIVNKALGSDKE